MAKRSRRSSHRRTKRRSVRSTRSRRHHRARHTRGRGKRMCGGMLKGVLGNVSEWGRNSMRNWAGVNHDERSQPDWLNAQSGFTEAEIEANKEAARNAQATGTGY